MKSSPDSASQNALNLLKLLQNQPVTAAEIEAICEFSLGSHPGSIAKQAAALVSDKAFIQSLQDQETKQIADAWQARVDSGLVLSTELSRQLIAEITSSIEAVAESSGKRVLTGSNIAEKDQGTDIPVRRSPGSVKGWSLQLTTRGIGEYKCLRQTFDTQPGDIVLISPDAFHEHRRSPQQNVWAHDWLYFHPDYRMTEWMHWPEVSPQIYLISLQDQRYQRVKEIFEAARDTVCLTDQATDAMQFNLVEQVLILCVDEIAGDKSLQVDSRVRQAMELVSENLELPLSVNDVAAQVKLSKTQLSSLFKSQLGCTLMTWREERRMAKATQLLAQTSRQIQEVAEQVGYEDPLYFSRVFSRWLGCSPRQYRKILSE